MGLTQQGKPTVINNMVGSEICKTGSQFGRGRSTTSIPKVIDITERYNKIQIKYPNDENNEMNMLSLGPDECHIKKSVGQRVKSVKLIDTVGFGDIKAHTNKEIDNYNF